MPTTHNVDAIVIDIEGTTSKAGFIFDVLFPYSRQRLDQWIERNASTAELIGRKDLSDTELAETLRAWIDEDRKAAPLKTIQGEIWAEGYAAGDLQSHLFGDVAPALTAWHQRGLKLFIYSSGSTKAQQSWFGNSPAGDLTTLLSGYFDITNAGPKREASSYRSIADAISIDPSRILFLSDVAEELAAAHESGWQVVGLSRAGEPYADNTPAEFTWVNSFNEIEIA